MDKDLFLFDLAVHATARELRQAELEVDELPDSDYWERRLVEASRADKELLAAWHRITGRTWRRRVSLKDVASAGQLEARLRAWYDQNGDAVQR